MKHNATLIRPSPELIEKACRSIKEELEESRSKAYLFPFDATMPSLRNIDREDSMVRLRIDGKSNKVTVEPHGSWFDVSFGSKTNPAFVSDVAKEFARERYDRRRSAEACEDVDRAVLRMVMSCPIRRMPRAEDRSFASYDFAGKKIKVAVTISVGDASSFGGVAGRYEDGTDVLRLIIPKDMTLLEVHQRWSEAKQVIIHELGHIVDPGRVLQRYGGGPAQRIQRLGFESIAQAEMAEEQFLDEGDEASARMAAEAISRAYAGYTGDPQEIRAESTAILSDMRKWIVTKWIPEQTRPLPSSMVWDVIRRRSRGTARGRWIAWMDEKSQAKMLAYIVQALMEEGLVS